ncbi:AAA family ATPase [Actinoplanes sp. TRM 88003]|uniref:AAA family ATPase n=1 Tax=Paractinoplanes aksuensis TaxID=2939490 RepID=A0ABT1E1U6_9ACTN|nr:LuxR family transcriptional regulator [Actinoplanes aksuensis]MCO8277097.1 AAA family ATPase [Actinoplanes aksuensis]
MTELCGRDRELADLAGRITVPAGGPGRLVVLEGPAGIGKTALAVAALTRVRGTTVLRARGSPLDQDYAFGIARQAFTGVASEHRALTDGEPARASTADATHAAIHDLVALTAKVAARRPTLLFVDDLQWADPPSQRWLAAVARRLDELPLALFLCVRTGERVLDDLLAGTVIPLGPLDRAAAEALDPTRAPTAGGIPFLLVHDSAEIGRWITRLLHELPKGCAPLATALSVLGPAARLHEAAELAGLTLAEAAPGADALRAAGLLAPGEWTLATPLIATAVGERLGAGERGLWHERAAALTGHDPERAAVHLLRTEPAARTEVVSLLHLAATRVAARGAPETAARYLCRALEESPTDPAPLQLDLALALAAERREGAAALAHEAVVHIADPAARAEAALRCGRALAITPLSTAAIAVLRIGLAAAPTPETRARLEAELAGAAGSDSRTMPLTREYVARSGTQPLAPVIAAVNATFDGEPAPRTLARLHPALPGLAAETDSVLPTVAALTLIANGDLTTAARMAQSLIDEAAPRGWLSTVAHGQFLRSLTLLPAGRITEALADARAATDFKLTSSTPPEGLLFALVPLLDALIEADRLPEAEDALRQSFPGEPPPHALSSPMLLQSRARLRWAQNRPADAITDLRTAAGRWAELGVRHPAFASWRADLVAPLIAAGDHPADLAAAHLKLAEAAEAPGPLSAALRTAALVAPRDQRLSLLSRAVDVCAGTSEHLASAHAATVYGAALRRAGRRDEARHFLRTAWEAAAAGGAHRLATRAMTELHATGARPRRPATHGPDALTDAEKQITALAADGLTNREIAQHLTLSRRTVETHLAHAYAKLAITSRRDLGAALNRG